MSAATSIQWTDTTWNPVRGCSIVSPGCVNCYAMKQAHRFSGEGKAYHGLTKLTERSGPQWTGVVRTVEDALLEPLSWRQPRKVFVNSMSDLFHEDVPFEFIDKVFAVMVLAHRHTFQILTKRAGRMRAYMDRLSSSATGPYSDWPQVLDAQMPWLTERFGATRMQEMCEVPDVSNEWPAPNVWLGVSAEDQQRADERIPLLLQTPAAVRFVSAEPLLGPLVIREQWLPHTCTGQHLPAMRGVRVRKLDWLIVGGESGPGARPMDLAWARSIVEQCKAAGVACFVKQLGAVPLQPAMEAGLSGPAVIARQSELDREWPKGTYFGNPTGDRAINGRVAFLRDRKGGDPSEWPEDLRVREWPEV